MLIFNFDETTDIEYCGSDINKECCDYIYDYCFLTVDKENLLVYIYIPTMDYERMVKVDDCTSCIFEGHKSDNKCSYLRRKIDEILHEYLNAHLYEYIEDSIANIFCTSIDDFIMRRNNSI